MKEKQKALKTTVMVTGATSGIGLATAVQLAARGIFVIGVGRTVEKCRQADQTIKALYPEAKTAFHAADLSVMEEVRELALRAGETARREGQGCIDALVNNAGAVSGWYTSTAEGFELQFAVNHLAPFLLTHELIPLLKAAPSARVITVSSGSHYRTKMHWEDVFLRKHYNVLLAYKQSKLANVLFTCELNRRLAPGSSVRAFAVDPGLVNTDIGLKGLSGLARWVWVRRSRRGIPPEAAAASLVYMVCEPSVRDTEEVYWKECRPVRPSRYSQREDAAVRLWELSEKLCGLVDKQHG